MNHRKLLLLSIRIGLITSITVLGWELPLRSVSSPECKGIPRNEMDEPCKLSILQQGSPSDDMDEYGGLIFSALRGASYTNPHTVGDGSHPSLDIATNQGTSVYSIADGEVVKAGFSNGGYGNSITVKHAFKDTFIYSNYSHLDVIEVSKGDSIKQGQKIGEVGRSGFTVGAYGYHLDFQITTDKSPSHPYGFHDCDSNYITTVNLGLCRDKLEEYTIDPVEFFRDYGEIDLRPIVQATPSTKAPVATPSKTTTPRPYRLPKNIDDFSVTPTTITKPVVARPQEIPASQGTIVEEVVKASPEQPTKAPTHLVETIETRKAGDDPYILTNDKRYRIRREISETSDKKEVGKFVTLSVFIEDPAGNEITGTLGEKITLEDTADHVSLLPNTISSVLQGKKHIFLKLLKAGDAEVTVYYGEQALGTLTFSISA